MNQCYSLDRSTLYSPLAGVRSLLNLQQIITAVKYLHLEEKDN